MNTNERALMRKLGINIIHLSEPLPGDNNRISCRGKFYIERDIFGPMSRLIKITSMIAESKNPAVMEMYGQLITMLHLTEEKDNGS